MKASIPSAARRTLGPILRPLLWHLRRWTGLRRELDEMRGILPAVVNASKSVGAIAHEQARIKREHDCAIAELRAAVAELRAGSAGARDARIVSAAKVEAARAAGAKLHLGPARARSSEYVHVDTHERPGVDVVSRFDALPFARGEVAEIDSACVLDRLAQDELVRVLAHWAGLLRSGGIFRATVLDGKATVAAVARGDQSFDQLRDTLFGRGALRNMFTAESLAAALRAAGLVDVQVVAEARSHGPAYELEVTARAA